MNWRTIGEELVQARIQAEKRLTRVLGSWLLGSRSGTKQQRRDGATMTALLFSLPRQRRPPSVMRDAVIRRLTQIAARLDRIYSGAEESDERCDGQWTIFSWLCTAENRFEKLLLCIENKIAPHLAARRDALEQIAEQRRRDAQLQREIDVERSRDAVNAAIDADPRVVAALADYESANQKLLAAIAIEEACESAMLAAPFPENVPLRKQLIPIRGKTTRARTATNRAYGALASVRDKVRYEFRNKQESKI
jgi:heme exporter protein D